LFDYVVTEQKGEKLVYHIPFPFTALLQRLEQSLEDDSPGSPLKRVLIPINRSLQRHVSQPKYFAYPRVVVGIDTEPRIRKDQAGMLLKDRLFLGYQEKSNIIEVISYNESAGRFEFQVVTNYGPNQNPVVRYANRALCTTCHQNHSPIFSRPLWDETNANPQVASFLEKQQREFYGIPIRQGIDIPNALDASTDRANMFSSYQLLWQEGCEHPTSPTDSIQCRTDLFRLLLQYRLSGTHHIHKGSSDDPKPVRPRLQEYWQQKWPQGLQIPNPDILNRNPLEFFAPKPPSIGKTWTQRAVFVSHGIKTRVRSIFEPSLPRPPLTIWSASEGSFEVGRILSGLSGFLAEADIKRLDHHLFRQGSRSMKNTVRHSTTCEARVRGPITSIDRIMIRCQQSESTDGKSRSPFFLEGVLYVKDNLITEGTVEQFSMDDENTQNDLEVVSGTLVRRGGFLKGSFELRQKGSHLHTRRANGNAIQNVTFQLSLSPGRLFVRDQSNGLKGSAIITTLNDFTMVHQAIEEMVKEALAGDSDLFARKPFRRSVLMRSLNEHLDMPSLTWCCTDDRRMPPAISALESHLHQAAATEEGYQSSQGIKAFQKYCAECHHEEEPFPPNFLHGTGQMVQQQVEHCAERILFRLHMWKLNPRDRPEAPMPPFTSLRRHHLSPNEWVDHIELTVLENYVADVLQTETGTFPELKDLASKGYDNLRPCLPPTQASPL
jgi:hypothetical protein